MSEGFVGADADVVDLAALAGTGAALCVRWYDEFLAGHEPSPVLLCDGLRTLEAVGTIPGVVGDAVGLLLAPQDVDLDTLVTALDLLRRYAHGAHDERADLSPADAGVQLSLPFDEAPPLTAENEHALRLGWRRKGAPASRRAYW